MIKIREDLQGIEETVSNRANITVVQDVLKMLNLNPNIPISRDPEVKLKQKNIDGSVTGVNTPLAELVEVTYTEVGEDNNDLSLYLIRPDQIPIYADAELGSGIVPIELTRKCNIEFKYFNKSKSKIVSVANDIRMKAANGTANNLHDIPYHFILTPLIIDLLGHITDLRNLRMTVPDSFEDYCYKTFDNRLTFAVPRDNVIQKYDMVIRMIQSNVEGHIADSLPDIQPEEDTTKGMWSVSFNYEYTYNKPISLMCVYPLLVFNTMIDKRFRIFSNNEYKLSTKARLSYTNEDMFKMGYRNKGLFIPGDKEYYSIPSYDPTILPNSPAMYQRILAILICVDPNNLRYLGNIYKLPGKIKFKANILKYIIEIEKDYIGSIHRGLLVVELYKNYKLDLSNPVIIMANGDLYTTYDMDIKSIYHLSFSIVTDLDSLTKEARKRVNDFINQEVMDIENGTGNKDNLINTYIKVLEVPEDNARNIIDNTPNPGDIIFKLAEIKYPVFRTKQISYIVTGLLEEKGV